MTTTAAATETCGRCGSEFETLDDVFSHDCSASRYVTRPNGFGGVTTTRRPAAAQTTADRPSDKQTAFIRSLLAERVGNEAAEAIRTVLNGQREAGELTKGAASAAIKSLLAIARNDRPAAAATTRPSAAAMPDVPEGRYAIRTDDGIVKFYRVDRPTEGKWAGWTFVKVQASDDLYPIRGEARRPVLTAIAADLQAAAALYGHSLDHCGFCLKSLTHIRSRAAGYGPDCADHHGLWYPTEAEARELLPGG